jgi:hypothetical protein
MTLNDGSGIQVPCWMLPGFLKGAGRHLHAGMRCAMGNGQLEGCGCVGSCSTAMPSAAVGSVAGSAASAMQLVGLKDAAGGLPLGAAGTIIVTTTVHSTSYAVLSAVRDAACLQGLLYMLCLVAVPACKQGGAMSSSQAAALHTLMPAC